MGDLLDRGAAFLDAQRHQHLSRPVLYRRGTDEKEVQATIGKTEFEQADDHGQHRGHRQAQRGARQSLPGRDRAAGQQPHFVARGVFLVWRGAALAVVQQAWDAMHRLVTQLNQIIGEVKSASDALGNASGQVSATAQSLSQSSSEQAASVEETTASIEQMTASITQNTENAKVTDNMATKSSVEATQGGTAAIGFTWETQDRARDVAAAEDALADAFAEALQRWWQRFDDPLLSELIEDATREEYTYLHTWRPGDVVMWDNRATQHYAVMDYPPCHRKMERAGIIGTPTF